MGTGTGEQGAEEMNGVRTGTQKRETGDEAGTDMATCGRVCTDLRTGCEATVT